MLLLSSAVQQYFYEQKKTHTSDHDQKILPYFK